MQSLFASRDQNLYFPIRISRKLFLFILCRSSVFSSFKIGQLQIENKNSPPNETSWKRTKILCVLSNLPNVLDVCLSYGCGDFQIYLKGLAADEHAMSADAKKCNKMRFPQNSSSHAQHFFVYLGPVFSFRFESTLFTSLTLLYTPYFHLKLFIFRLFAMSAKQQ